MHLSSFVGLSAAVVGAAAQQFTNPVIYEDLPDLDVFRVNNTYYYSSSTFAYSPGAPVLTSTDLVNWKYVGHSVPTLSFSSQYDLTNGQSAYVKGIWASTLRYRASKNLFYWYGCIQSTGKTYVYTASDVTGPWKLSATMNKCYYDCGVMVDDNDTMYIAYGNNGISVAQLAADGFSEVKSQVVYNGPNKEYIEGSRLYKIKGYYFIFVTQPANEEWALRSKSIFGSYEMKKIVVGTKAPLYSSTDGVAYTPHQGGVVDTPDGNWYYMAFIDAYPNGRIPVLAPLTWSNDWPSVQLVNGAWGKTYSRPIATVGQGDPVAYTDTFNGTSLSHKWEWNHNPDTSKFSVNNGLTLSTATVTQNIFNARNTLTHRIPGPISSGIFRFDVCGMANGDRAGLAMFRDWTSYVGVHKENNSTQIVLNWNATLSSSWTVQSAGSVSQRGPTLTASQCSDVYFKIVADTRPWFNVPGGMSKGVATSNTFHYSLDGTTWTQIGGNNALNLAYNYFTAYRFAAFNFATSALGGKVLVKSFQITLP